MFNLVWIKDCIERASDAALSTFITLVLAGTVTNVPTAKAAAISAGAAALSVIKSTLAARVPGTISPASVVES